MIKSNIVTSLLSFKEKKHVNANKRINGYIGDKYRGT